VAGSQTDGTAHATVISTGGFTWELLHADITIYGVKYVLFDKGIKSDATKAKAKQIPYRVV